MGLIVRELQNYNCNQFCYLYFILPPIIKKIIQLFIPYTCLAFIDTFGSLRYDA